jgi:hypothetical protein
MYRKDCNCKVYLKGYNKGKLVIEKYSSSYFMERFEKPIKINYHEEWFPFRTIVALIDSSIYTPKP